MIYHLKKYPLIIIMFLSLGLSFCSGEGSPGDLDFPDGSDAVEDLKDKTAVSPQELEFYASIDGSNSTPIENGDIIKAGDANYKAGFTVESILAKRYTRSGKPSFTWANTSTFFYDINTGKKLAAQNDGEYVVLDDETKNAILCNSKKARVFITFADPEFGGTGEHKFYIEAPPLELIGDKPTTC